MVVRSRLKRHQVKETRKQTIWYLLLSVLFVTFMVKWGLPGLIQLMSVDRGTSQLSGSREDELPLQAPVLSPLPEATPSAYIRVEGVGQSGQTIRLLVNGAKIDEDETDTDGSFAFDRVKLTEGENTIGVQAVDDQGKESAIREGKVILDTDAPEISITEPAEESQFYGRDQQQLEIKGEVSEEETGVSVNGNYVSVNTEKKFVYRTKLTEGVNEFVIVAVDRAGNRTEKLFRVSFSL